MQNNLIVTLNYFNYNRKQIDIEQIYNVYVYGSVNYETDDEESDVDYIIITDQVEKISDTISANMGGTKLDATLINPTHFNYLLEQHSIDALECLFIRDDFKYESIIFNYQQDLVKLRKSISEISSNSYVKCRKKMMEGNLRIGYKSLFHSLRILDYGIQLASLREIKNLTTPESETLKKLDYNFKELLNDIKSYDNWIDLETKYKKIYNNLKSEFKLLAPKTWKK